MSEQVREEWAIRWPDGSVSGAMYSTDGSDYAEQTVRAVGAGEEIVHRTVTITSTEWEPLAAPSPSEPR
jgi:hypothetical protein